MKVLKKRLREGDINIDRFVDMFEYLENIFFLRN